MAKVFFCVVAVLLSSLLLAQTQMTPVKPGIANIPFLPLLTTMNQNDIIGPYGSVWKIYWDGWEGELVLFKGGTGYIKSSDGNKYNLTYSILRNPQDSVSGMTGPGYTGKNSNIGHRIVFLVDFANTANNTQDDQRFDGYIFTQTIKNAPKRAMAGITWWDGIPFGFYAIYWYDVPG
ncbi:MAG: hypothetical protein WHT65_00390 [Pseudothermotoga sp.]